MNQSFTGAVIMVLQALEPGEVVSYGEVAEQAGFPGAARAVGNLLRAEDGLPWWRVVTADGRLVPGSERRQARLLRAEGIEVREGRVAAIRRAPMRPRAASEG
jgi:methylated-DNA-protein-cysteine methyltransferase-like protein